MNILGKLVTEASASVTRAPQNLWMDEAAEEANPDTEATTSTEERKA